MSSVMSVIVCYAIVGLCLIVAVSLFSESHIFLGILAVIFGICVMIQMSSEIGWGKVFLPVIVIVSITLFVYLIKFIGIMTKVLTTKPVCTEEDIRNYADRLTDYLLSECPRVCYKSSFVSEQVRRIIGQMGVPNQLRCWEIENIVETYDWIYESKTQYLQDVLEQLKSDFVILPIGQMAESRLPDVFSLDHDILSKVLEIVEDRICQKLQESKKSDAVFVDMYYQAIMEDILQILADRNTETESISNLDLPN